MQGTLTTVIKYKGETVGTINAEGTKTLEVSGCLMSDDITLETTEVFPKLSTPTLSQSNGIFSITPVTGATSYDFYYNHPTWGYQLIGNTTATSGIDITTLSGFQSIGVVGPVPFTVIAKNDNDEYLPSDRSNAIGLLIRSVSIGCEDCKIDGQDTLSDKLTQYQTKTYAITTAINYAVPTTLSITGATYQRNSLRNGTLTISAGVTDFFVIGGTISGRRYYNIGKTLTGVTSDASNPTEIISGETAVLHFTPNSDYVLPSSITVTNAQYTWSSSTGTLTLSNPTDTVSVIIVANRNYLISTTLTNTVPGVNNPTKILQNSTADLTFTAQTGYNLPDTVTVSGATYTWNKTTGVLHLSNPTGNVSITISSALNAWSTPTITLSDSTVSTDIVEGVTKYKVYADGEYIGYVDADNEFHKKWSCTVTGLGSENPNNVTFTHDGTMPEFEEVTVGGNAFIKIPTMYRKVNTVVDGQITSFTISNVQPDSPFASFHPYSVFVKEDGTTVMPYVLIGKYNNSASSSSLNSVNATPVRIQLPTAREMSEENGAGYQLFDWQFQKLWQDLLMCKAQTIDIDPGTSVRVDQLGIIWINGSNAFTFVDGGTYQPTTGKWYVSHSPSKYTDDADASTDSYREVSYVSPLQSGSYVKKLGYDSSEEFFNYPVEVGGTPSTYYCDQFMINKNESVTCMLVTCFRGYNGKAYGPFYFINTAFNDPQYARLCYRPI